MKALLFLIFIANYALSNELYCHWAFLPQEKRAHEYIVHDLYSGKIVEGHEFQADNMNQIFKVKVYNEQTGAERWAMFKPKIEGDGFGYHRVTMEYVAYKTNRWLGMDYIAPVAYRKNLTLNGQNYPEGGALIFFVDDAHSLQSVERKLWDLRKKNFTETDQDLFYSDTQVLDTLLQNHDRHKDNFLRAKHWTDGSYRPLLIDHGAVLKDWSGAIKLKVNDEPLKVVRKKTLEKLKGLNKKRMKEEFSEFLKDEEIDYILKNRDSIVDYFEKLANKNGREKVIIDR